MPFDWKNVSPPPQVAALPVDPRGFPVPVVTPRSHSEYEFGGISAPRVVLCGVYELCGVCGCALGDEVWEVSDDEGTPVEVLQAALDGGTEVRNLAPQGEAPLHYECALYAASVCPYLANPTARRTNSTVLDKRGSLRPERMVLKRVDGFELVESPQFGFGFRYGRLLGFEVVEAEAEAASRLATFMADSPPARGRAHAVWSSGADGIMEEAVRQIRRRFPHLSAPTGPTRPPVRSEAARRSKRKAQGSARKASRKRR